MEDHEAMDDRDGFLPRLWHRRVPQILGAYVMAGVAVVGFVPVLIERYDLSQRIFDATLVAFLTMIPAIFLLAYTHGAPGKQSWGVAERFGIPFNLLVTLALVIGVVATDSQVEALTETVEVVNVDGSVEERLRPRVEQRRELALFFWGNETGDASLDWLRYGFPLLLERDLEQNPFFDVNDAFSFTTELGRAGITDALDVPVALAQRSARDRGITYFADGSFSQQDDELTASLTIYTTETAEPVSTLTASATTFDLVVDELSVAVREALDVVDIEELGRDLPVTEHTSAELEAIEKWITGLVAMGLGNQVENAVGSWQEATALDPTFAVAYGDLAQAYYSLGSMAEAVGAAANARQHDYRLSERERLSLSVFDLMAQGQFKKITLVLEQITTLFPADVDALKRLALVYSVFGDVPKSIETYQQVLELDPTEHEARLEVGRLYSRQGDYAGAREAFRRYLEARPNDPDVRLELAKASWFEGDLEETRKILEEAQVVASSPLDIDILLAELERAEGNVVVAERRLDQLSNRVTVPQDQQKVDNALIRHYSELGRYEEGLAVSGRLREALLKVSQPFMVELAMMSYETALLGALDRVDEARAKIDVLADSGREPFASYAQLFYLNLGIVSRDAELIREKLEVVSELAKQIDEPQWPQMIIQGKGVLAELDGDAEAASEYFAEAFDMLQGSLLAGERLYHGMLLTHQARVAITAGQLDVADERLERLLAINPASPEGNFQAARLAFVRDDVDAARRHLDVAVEM
ncbi:MAG: tetratricopeptide repeat protein, partial [Acidobacteriota bacterium]